MVEGKGRPQVARTIVSDLVVLARLRVQRVDVPVRADHLARAHVGAARLQLVRLPRELYIAEEAADRTPSAPSFWRLAAAYSRIIVE